MTHKWIVKKVVKYAAGLVASITTINILFGKDGLITIFLGVNLSFLITVLTTPLILFFTSGLIKALITSGLAEIISRTLNCLGLALMIHLFIKLAPNIPAQILSVNNLFLECMLVAIFSYMVKSIANLYHEPILVDLVNFISILLLGFILADLAKSLLMPLHLPFELNKKLHEIIFWSFIITAIISPLSILRNFSNLYLRSLGRKISLNMAGIFFLIFSALTYFLSIRSYLLYTLERVGFPLPVNVIEWGVICLSFYLFYRSLKRYIEENLTEPLYLGSWTKLEQRIEHYISNEHLSASGIVRDFIEHGRKDGVISYLVSALLFNGVSMENIREIVAEIVNYQDMPYPKICLRPWVRGIDEENKRRRMMMLDKILNKVDHMIISRATVPERRSLT